ncbi:sensor histidine kinase [Klugiella xanthotipulae]|nr:sensor histidine kinase [Klugiella xanthotipulae]
MTRWSIAKRFFIGQLSFILLLAIVGSVALVIDAADRIDRETRERMLTLSTSVALNPFVIDAVQTAHPSELLQPYAESLMDAANADFITIMDTHRIRYTHRNRDMIGGRFEGNITPALHGQAFTEIHNGSLGPTVRGIVPITSSDGTVIAIVSSGVTVSNVNLAVNARLPLVAAVAATLILVGALISLGLSRYLRRVTYGRGPEQISQMYAFYDAVLHSIGEGMLLVNPQGELVLYNTQAAELLGLPPMKPEAPPLPLRTADLPAELGELLAGGTSVDSEVVLTPSRVLLVTQRPARASGTGGRAASLGTVAIIRDRTDMQRLSGELDSMHTLADALRSQTHEHSNRLHTIVTLIELGRGDEALRFATHEVEQGQILTDRVVNAVGEPALSALLVGKTAQASERGVSLIIVSDGVVPPHGISAHDAVTIMGNLIDNALDAAARTVEEGAETHTPEERWVEVVLISTATELTISVLDSGLGLQGLRPEELWARGFSTKQDAGQGRGIGLALVRQTARSIGGTITVEDSEETVAGARFTVTVPFHAANRPSDQDEAR